MVDYSRNQAQDKGSSLEIGGGEMRIFDKTEEANNPAPYQRALEYVFSEEKEAAQLRKELASYTEKALGGDKDCDIILFEVLFDELFKTKGIILSQEELRKIFWIVSCENLEKEFAKIINFLAETERRRAGQVKEQMQRSLFALLKIVSGDTVRKQDHSFDSSCIEQQFHGFLFKQSKSLEPSDFSKETEEFLNCVVRKINADRDEIPRIGVDKQIAANASPADPVGSKKTDENEISRIPMNQIKPGLMVEVHEIVPDNLEIKEGAPNKSIVIKKFYEILCIPFKNKKGLWTVGVKCHHKIGVLEENKFRILSLAEMGIVPYPDGKFDAFNKLIKWGPVRGGTNPPQPPK